MKRLLLRKPDLFSIPKSPACSCTPIVSRHTIASEARNLHYYTNLEEGLALCGAKDAQKKVHSHAIGKNPRKP